MKKMFDNVDFNFIAPMELHQDIEIPLNKYNGFYGKLIYTPENDEFQFAVIANDIYHTNKWYEDEEKHILNQELQNENSLIFDKFCFVKGVIKDTINDDFIAILNQNTIPTKQEIINAFYEQINFAYEEFTKKED